MFLVNEDTRKQLEVLTMRKLTVQKNIRDINSRMCCMNSCPLGIPNAQNPLLDGFEAQRRLLLQQLMDIESKIDELQSKN